MKTLEDYTAQRSGNNYINYVAMLSDINKLEAELAMTQDALKYAEQIIKELLRERGDQFDF